jgi:hypothetical protein
VIQAGYGADARRRQQRRDGAQIAGPHDDIAVGKYNGIMLHVGQHVDQVRDFAVTAVAAWIDVKLDRLFGMLALHGAHGANS